jgi:hypothetical protein
MKPFVPPCPQCKTYYPVLFSGSYNDQSGRLNWLCFNCQNRFITKPIPYEEVEKFIPACKKCLRRDVELTRQCGCFKGHEVYWCHNCMIQFDYFKK